MVEKPYFKDINHELKSRANLPGCRALVTLLESIGKGLAADISTVLRDENVSITTDGWTFFIAEQWELVAFPLSCTMFEGSTTGMVARMVRLKAWCFTTAWYDA